ncbi:serine/arginine repetitive matrix protein 3-like [Cavia porcellus]|uniref:serine/arginine repetitive matrix protein 3-like n=1 Tax=Cavia porcellus TaxID=10141 RepID=UPI002FE06F89
MTTLRCPHLDSIQLQTRGAPVPGSALSSAKRPRDREKERGVPSRGERGSAEGAPSSRGTAGAGSKGSASSQPRTSGGGGGEERLPASGFGGVGGGSFLRPAAGAPPEGVGGETVGGRPGRGWRRRCHRRRRRRPRRRRRGGRRCRSCRRRYCLLLRPRRGESERKRRRGARRAPQLDRSLQLQALAPPLPGRAHNQSPLAAGPEPQAHWSAAAAVRAGLRGGGENTAGIRFPPQISEPPLSPPLGPRSAPEGWSQ